MELKMVRNKPKVALKSIEYLLLSIHLNPGKSQRFHLRRLWQYKHGTKSYNNGASSVGFFSSPSYRDVLWYDDSNQNVKYGCSVSKVNYNPWTSGGYYRSKSGQTYTSYAYKTKCSELYLTDTGEKRLKSIKQKIGMK